MKDQDKYFNPESLYEGGVHVNITLTDRSYGITYMIALKNARKKLIDSYNLIIKSNTETVNVPLTHNEIVVLLKGVLKR